jgi:hypothetical protein
VITGDIKQTLASLAGSLPFCAKRMAVIAAQRWFGIA